MLDLHWDYRHDIEYRRELAKGHRVHTYTERAEDMGFCFSQPPGREQQWLVHYTRACAEDFLYRVEAPSGDWIVSVYRRPPDRSRQHIVTIRMRWQAPDQDADVTR
ncbi:hypothetical protein EV191_114101 [Tamaricihabitans halophyticus]|uniref:Uncharacterized protein n=1 Tax=Tamaricihabitans halophyticus TaxID=1262583 RepID=A0A4R2QD16_9PSEU|nr:hypothetical protein [Tamaricihabitans halophyticus]TCP46304.1 hypothetical protein EV191_114101 [Tamaricihabitans halophyticus]